jgi:hypothetical protein
MGQTASDHCINIQRSKHQHERFVLVLIFSIERDMSDDHAERKGKKIGM